MQFECPVCQASYNVPDDRFIQTVNKAVCKKCGTTMLINKETGEIETEPTAEEHPSETFIKDTRMADALPSVLSMSAQNQSKRDYLAISVVALTLCILIAAGLYLVFGSNKSILAGPFKSVTRFLDDFTDFTQFFSGEAFKKKRPQSKLSRKAERYTQQGYNHYQQKRYKKAIAEYSKALQLDSSNPEAYFWRARSLMKSGQFDKAIEDLNKAVEFDPGHTKALDNLGWLYMKRGDFDKSIGYLNQSIELRPDNAWAYYTRGHIYVKQGDIQKGLIDADKACKMGYKDGCNIYNKYKK